MIDPKILDELSRRVAGAIPPGLHELQHDFEKNLRAALAGAINRLDLVSREEFEVQRGVLMRSRARLEELERKVAELETQLAAKPEGK